MEPNGFNPPDKILESTGEVGVLKARRKVYKQLLLAFLAGVYIAFASEGSSMAAFNLLSDPSTQGLGRLVAGVVFGTGLMLVVIAGGELFSGNMLVIVAVLNKKIKLGDMLKNWVYVYAGNFVGAVFIAVLIYLSGQLNTGDGLLGGMTVKIAYNKVSYPFMSALVLGIMCNWLVCLAVWSSYAAKDITGKVLLIFFIIALFIISGFEHCIANMYYIPAGILAKTNAVFAERSGLSLEQLSLLNWKTFFVNNLLPVTLGNIIGGSFFVGCFYKVIYGRKDR